MIKLKKMNKKYIVITDYSKPGVYITEFDTNIFDVNDNIQDFYDVLNEVHDTHLKESQCTYMIADEKLPVTYL